MQDNKKGAEKKERSDKKMEEEQKIVHINYLLCRKSLLHIDFFLTDENCVWKCQATCFDWHKNVTVST